MPTRTISACKICRTPIRIAPGPRRENIIPTTTGAAKAVGVVIPELKGKLDRHFAARAGADRQRGRSDGVMAKT